MAKVKTQKASRSALGVLKGAILRLMVGVALGVAAFIALLAVSVIKPMIDESSRMERLEHSLPPIPEGVRVFGSPDELVASKPATGDTVWFSGYVWRVRDEPAKVFIWGFPGTNAMDLEFLRGFNSMQCLPTANSEALTNNQRHTLTGEVRAVTPKNQDKSALYIELTNCTVFSAGGQ